MKKRLLLALLVLCLTICAFSVTVGAEGTETIISNVAELQAFATVVNDGDTFAGKTVKLGADIDLKGIEWTPIGGWDAAVQFMGEFDGQDHIIYNLTLDDTNATATKYRAGLFADLGQDSSVHDLTIKTVNITNTKGGQVGALAGRSGASLENVYIENFTANAASGAYVGAVVGITNYYDAGDYGFSWKNVDSKDVTITFNGTKTSYGGGLLGGMNPNGARLNTYQNCDVTNVTITDENIGWHGGMWGWHRRSGAFDYVKNCSVTNVKITTEGTDESRLGGICGFVGVSGGVFENVTVNGGVLTAGGGYAGGFTPWSYAWGQDVYKKCTVTNVTATCETGTAGGFIAAAGAGNQTSKCVDCDVVGGTVTGKIASGFAGIDRVGNAGGAYVLESCTSSATVSGTEYAAGLIARASSDYVTSVVDSVFEGEVTGNGHVCEGVITTHVDKSLLTVDSVPALYINIKDENGDPIKETANYIAEVNGEYYQSLREAIKKANSISGGTTVTLLDNASIDAAIEVSGDKDITINGNGNTITWAEGYTGTLFNIGEDASLTTTDVVIDGENAFTFYNDTTTVENGQNWYTRFVDVGTEDKKVNADVIVNAGELNLGKGTVIQNVTIASDGGNGKTENTETGYVLKYNDDLAIIKSNGGTITMNGADITGNAGLILNAVNAKTTIDDSTIDGNMGCGNKGGIIIANGGTMKITYSFISNNKAMARSATILGVINGAEVDFDATMDNNKHIGVDSNTAGAMVVLEGASQFNMNGGSISDNVGGRAGAIASRWVGGSYGQHEDTSIVLNSGSISGNTATNDSWNGASVFLRSPTEINDGMEIEGPVVVNAAPAELDINGGNFDGSLIVTDGLDATIYNGTFSYDPSEWCIEGYTGLQNSDGTYGVVEASEEEIDNKAVVTINVNPADADVIIKSGSEKVAEGGGAHQLLGGTYTYTASKTGYEPTSGSFTVAGEALTVTIELVAIPTYTVTYDYGYDDIIDTETVYENEYAPYFELERDGYIFDGWYNRFGWEFDFETPITRDITLYAQWTREKQPEVVIYMPVSTAKTENGSIDLRDDEGGVSHIVYFDVDPDKGYTVEDVWVVDAEGNNVRVTREDSDTYSFRMPNSAVTIGASFKKVLSYNPFADVVKGEYYYDAVLWAVDNGITTGMDGLFLPYNDCTRGQFVTFLWRAAGCPAPKATSSAFVDVDPSAYYYNAMLWAVENGITTGMSAETFNPDGIVDRGQVVTFLYRYAGAPRVTGGESFVDVDPTSYCAAAVQWAVDNDITQGTSAEAKTFNPLDSCTRGQVVTFLYRFFG